MRQKRPHVKFTIELEDTPNFDMALVRAKEYVDSFEFSEKYCKDESSKWDCNGFKIGFESVDLEYSGHRETTTYTYYFIAEPSW